MKGAMDLLAALGDSPAAIIIPTAAIQKDPFEWEKWAFATGLITEEEFRASIGLPSQGPMRKSTSSPSGARCPYCRTIATHPTQCQNCGAPR